MQRSRASSSLGNAETEIRPNELEGSDESYGEVTHVQNHENLIMTDSDHGSSREPATMQPNTSGSAVSAMTTNTTLPPTDEAGPQQHPEHSEANELASIQHEASTESPPDFPLIPPSPPSTHPFPSESDSHPCHLFLLPPELLTHLLTFLPLSSLLALSRTCHALRHYSLLPYLHRTRRRLAVHALAVTLPHRPPLVDLKPPRGNVYFTNATWNARHVERLLKAARLKGRLERRVSVGELVRRGVLWSECWICVDGGLAGGCEVGSIKTKTETETARSSYDEISGLRGRGQTWQHSHLSPRVVSAKRGIEKEYIKDRLRGWVEGKGKQELERRAREEKREKLGVGQLVRRFMFMAKSRKDDGDGAKKVAEVEKWGRGAEKEAQRRLREPTRAMVLGLRRFWEGKGREVVA